MEKELKISLAAARVNAGLTQREFAKACGVSETTVISWEAGKTFPSIGKLSKLEKVLGISVANIRWSRK